MLELLKRSLRRGVLTGREDAGPLRGPVVLDLEQCMACGQCALVCPTGALKGFERPQVDPFLCLGCGSCVRHCEAKALKLGVRPAEISADIPPNSPGVKGRLRARSLHIRHLDAGSCNGCDFEMAALLNPVYDVQRLGFDFVASPRHADILLVTGAVTRNMELAVRRTYDAVPFPKLVVAVGACAGHGGAVADGYAVVGPVESVLPVNVRIPGCPPRPTAIIDGLMAAREVYARLFK